MHIGFFEKEQIAIHKAFIQKQNRISCMMIPVCVKKMFNSPFLLGNA